MLSRLAVAATAAAGRSLRPPLAFPRTFLLDPASVRGFSGFQLGNQYRRVLRPQPVKVVQQRHIHPVALLVARSVAKIIAVFTGRRFRQWWKALPADKRQYFMQRLRENRKKIAWISAGLGTAVSVFYYAHLQETPLTGRTRFIVFNEEQMKKINEFSRDAQYEMVKDKLLPSNHPYVRRVSRVAKRLLDSNNDIKEIFSKQWSVSVINSPIENAFVDPSGQICVFVGMLGVCENDDQLGCVLAHEISHAILDHGAELISYTTFVDLFIILALAGIWAIMPTDMVAAVTSFLFDKVCTLTFQLPYSRLLETEADLVGLELAAKACLDVRESSAFWAKMSLLNQLQDGDPLPEFLSTHPDSAKRCETLDAMMDSAIQKRIECKCASLPRVDPRHSIEGLKHQITALKKWREANGREGVLLIPVRPP